MTLKASRPERRRGARKALAFGINFKQVNNVPLKTKWAHECGVNLSPRGLCACSYRKLPEKAKLRCLLLFRPPYDRELLEVRARVVWQQARVNAGETLWYHGLQFESVNSTTQRLLVHMAECTYDKSATT